MTTCIKAKLKKSDDQTNIYKYDRVAANITEYQKYVKMAKWKGSLWTYGLFGHNYRVAALSTLYLTVLGIIIPSL